MRGALILVAALPSAGAWAVAGRTSPHAGCCTQRRVGPAAKCAADGAYGEGMTQSDMMEKDMLILVDGADRVSGSMSKRAAHTFDAENPRGRLHRAFSCFLFDSVSAQHTQTVRRQGSRRARNFGSVLASQAGRMLLTKRAASKITFPNVWTNACCSHPLHGRVPEEVDNGADLGMPGSKHAARRKLQHELGVDPAQVCCHSG